MPNQNLKVLVLDALDGKPQANVKVDYFCTGFPLNSAHKESSTNSDGLAEVSVSCNDKQKIEISVYPPGKKEQCGDSAVMTFNDVLSIGFVSDTDSDGEMGGMWCPKKVSKTVKPVPGEAILFVKKPTWWQSHVAG